MSLGEVRGSLQTQERNRAKSRTRVQGLADIDPKFISQVRIKWSGFQMTDLVIYIDESLRQYYCLPISDI